MMAGPRHDLMDSDHSRSSVPSARFRVLLIEPRHDVGFVLKKLIEHEGHEVQHVTDGREGIELSGSLNPDIVMSAVSLPGFDGFEVAREIVKRTLHKPLMVAVTSYSKTDIGAELRDAGFDLYLPKPVSRETLLTTLGVRAGGVPAEETLL